MDDDQQTAQTATTTATVAEVEPQVFIRRSKNSKYIIEYRRDACIGAVSCSAIAPHTFAMDDENKAILLPHGEDGSEDDDEIILAAAQSCPVFAIIIKDAATGEQIFPPVDY